jgi:flagellin-like hook-associated protein FlgL
MGDIVLSAGVRQNLLALQNSAQLMGVAQNRLATGKKVNSALDNPFNFFTSQSLSNRARDLNALLDSIGQGQQTIAAADHGITAIAKLVESAKAIAKQAQQTTSPTVTYPPIAGNTAIAADTAATLTGSVTGIVGGDFVSTLGVANNDVISISDGTNTTSFTVTNAATTTVSQLMAGLTGGTAGATASLSAGALQLVENGTTNSLTISSTGSVAGLGFGAGNTTAAPGNTTIGALTGSLTVRVGAAATQTINFGAGNVTNRAQLATALAGLTGVTATINGSNQVEITPTSSETLTIGGTGTGATGLFAPANIAVHSPVGTLGTPNATRSTLQLQYNELLTQIDGLAKDASYNGVNLLASDDLKITFNEDGTSFLNITGVDFTSAGLGLTAAVGTDFQTNGGVDAFVGRIDSALATLRAQASVFGSKLGTVQTRQDFTNKLIKTLETGADNLVLADTNEEGANMLALQTRQQLSTTALSLSAQADQAVLRLFG